MDLDPSVSIAIYLCIPIVFVINLIIASGLYLFKKKELSGLFVLNSIIASILMYFLFAEGIDRHQNRRLESWKFTKGDTVFDLVRWKEINEFSLSYSTVQGLSLNFLDGNCQFKNGEWILTTDSTLMKIRNDYLIGFRKQSDTIKMKKIVR